MWKDIIMKIWTRKAWDKYISDGHKKHAAFVAARAVQ